MYAVKWNWIHHRTFLSASADWSVRLWDSADQSKPVMSFDLNDSVSGWTQGARQGTSGAAWAAVRLGLTSTTR